MVDEFRIVQERLTELNRALSDAVSTDDQDAIPPLLAEISALERRRNRLVHRVASEQSYDPTPSLRDQVIRSSGLIGRPASIKLIADVSTARYGERLPTTRLASLRRDEERSWASSGPRRAVYVVPALSVDRFFPVRATLALSTWPLDIRVVGPASSRVDLLWTTKNLAAELETGANQRWVPALRRLLWRLATSIPGATTGGSEIDPGQVTRAAERELEVIEPDDAAERLDAAERAGRQLTDAQQRFGGPGLRAMREAKEAM